MAGVGIFIIVLILMIVALTFLASILDDQIGELLEEVAYLRKQNRYIKKKFLDNLAGR